MPDIHEFLTARLDEQEAAARAATDGPWRVGTHVGRTLYCRSVPGVPKSGTLFGVMDRSVDADHVAFWGPDRALAEIAAKRKVIAEYESLLGHRAQYQETAEGWGARTKLRWVLQVFAAAYADHPDYDTAWGAEEWRGGSG